MQANPIPGNGGDTYVPYDQRTGEESTVFFTPDLSAEGLNKVFAHVADRVSGKIAVKVHTGEKDGPNIIPREWVADLFAKQLPDATIVLPGHNALTTIQAEQRRVFAYFL